MRAETFTPQNTFPLAHPLTTAQASGGFWVSSDPWRSSWEGELSPVDWWGLCGLGMIDQGLRPVLSVQGRLQTLPHRCLHGLIQLPGCRPAAARQPGWLGGVPQGEAMRRLHWLVIGVLQQLWQWKAIPRKMTDTGSGGLAFDDPSWKSGLSMAFPLSLNLVPPQMLRENPLGQSMQEMLQNLCTLIDLNICFLLQQSQGENSWRNLQYNKM